MELGLCETWTPEPGGIFTDDEISMMQGNWLTFWQAEISRVRCLLRHRARANNMDADARATPCNDDLCVQNVARHNIARECMTRTHVLRHVLQRARRRRQGAAIGQGSRRWSHIDSPCLRHRTSGTAAQTPHTWSMRARTHLFVLETQEKHLLHDGEPGGLPSLPLILVLALQVSRVVCNLVPTLEGGSRVSYWRARCARVRLCEAWRGRVLAGRTVETPSVVGFIWVRG